MREGRVAELIQQYSSGSLSESGFEELEEALRESSKYRRFLVETRALEVDLRDHFSGVRGLVHEFSGVRDNLRKRRGPIGKARALVAGGIFIAIAWAVFTVGWRQWYERPAVDRGVAVLTRSIDAHWDGPSWSDGEGLSPGTVRLGSGTVELEFYSGASVILEAPAELDLVSEDRGNLKQGKLRAEVPLHARGFTISTPEIEVVDLGTSFGIEVGADLGTRVHVFDGEIEIFRPGQPGVTPRGESLLAGDGREIGPDGRSSVISVDEGRFLSRDQFDRIVSKRQAKRYRRWTGLSSRLMRDDSVIAYYDFELDIDWPRSLVDRSIGGSEGSNGIVVGAARVTGRWPEKSALDFKRPSDRVRIRLPGMERSITLVAWVRIDGLDNRYNSLLLSDGWGRAGALHWQIRNDSQIVFSVSRGNRGGKMDFAAPFPMTPSDFGRWTQVGLVYDGEKHTVTHYRDGAPIGNLNRSLAELEIGGAEIGNWSPPKRRGREVRNFNGRIDEFVIYRRALSGSEMKSRFLQGMP